MNGYELWRLREFGLSGVELERNRSDWWSKHNCPVNRRNSLYDKKGLFSPPTLISSCESLQEATCSRLPQILVETPVDLGRANKVFAAQWFTDDKVVMGTKCNSLLVLDTKKANNHAITQIPSLKSTRPILLADQNCGIHAVHINPSATMLATGSENPADVAVYSLPSFEPVCVGESAHSEWIFDLKWLDDEFLVSGSRDSTLALFRFIPKSPDDDLNSTDICGHSSRFIKNGTLTPYPINRPVVIKKLQKFDKVRALTYNKLHKVLTSVSLNCYMHVLDMETFRQVHLKKLNNTYSECVCLCHSSDENSLVIGSRMHFAFFDSRTLNQTLDVKLPSRTGEHFGAPPIPMPSGVRSVSWRGPLVTLGTGSGEILFYDVRACKFLECDCSRSAILRISGGWLQRDETFQEIFMNFPCPNAVYTHCYDGSGTRLFAAGGPIAASLVGNYAAIWQ